MNGCWSSPFPSGQFCGSRSRYIRNFAKEKKPNVIALGRTSHPLAPETALAIALK